MRAPAGPYGEGGGRCTARSGSGTFSCTALGKLWRRPQVTGAGLLYRRTDQAPDVPATWQELYAEAAKANGCAYQAPRMSGSRATSSSSPPPPAGGSSPRTARRARPTNPRTLRYAKEVPTAGEGAAPPRRPPVYSQISEAVSTNVNEAIGGQMSPEDALKRIEKALSSF